MDIYGRSFLAKLDPGEVVTPGNRVYLVNPAWMTQDDSEGSDLAISVDPQQIPVTILNNGGALTKDSILIVHSIGDRLMANVRKQMTGLGCGGFLMPNRAITLAWTFMDGTPPTPRTIIVPLTQTTPGGSTWQGSAVKDANAQGELYTFNLACYGTAWNLIESYRFYGGGQADGWDIWYSMDRASAASPSPLNVQWSLQYTGRPVFDQQSSCYVDLSADTFGYYANGVIVMEKSMKLY
jgi:hypothetical protein